jgi:hypothetical protein
VFLDKIDDALSKVFWYVFGIVSQSPLMHLIVFYDIGYALFLLFEIIGQFIEQRY